MITLTVTGVMHRTHFSENRDTPSYTRYLVEYGYFELAGGSIYLVFGVVNQVMRRRGNLGALSGADGSRYMEYDSRPPKKHPLFKSRYVKM